MNNNTKIEDIKSEPLTTEQKEFMISGLFSMMSNEDNQFVSKEKYDESKNKINKAIKYMEDNCDIIKLDDGYVIRSELSITGLSELFKILKG